VDFGEVGDDKFFVVADVEKGRDTSIEWRKLDGVRPFVDRRAVLTSADDVTGALIAALPGARELQNAIVRLTIEYPRDLETLIDEPALRKHVEQAFEFHLVKRPQTQARIRLPADQTVSSLGPLDLLEQYWRASGTEHADELQMLASEIISGDPKVP
jgi:hypothetical protein